MKKALFRLPLLALLLLGFGVYGQTLSGIVMSAEGPLPGATVQVQGTNRGVSTDFDGNFLIEADADAVLIVSYVGYATQSVAVAGQDSLIITLLADNELEEVVVLA